MTPYIQPPENLLSQGGLTGLIRRNAGSWTKLLQPVAGLVQPRIDGLEVTESTLEEWMAVEQQFDARVERRWF
ncbi:hypothetical protein RQP53_17560 [Paucibacter sp. APW11]|uniref:Transposase n=1 Tax=Roseateles aquae TaxID=3077235 RepID=A0ABU3PEQ7_9BURK|nr:hypothetical protein [Paucibacter sp. APW11]MDT9001090.1 hypothetical protein [Paucibacter sp. APW11]